MVRHKTRWLLVRLDFEPDVVLGPQRPLEATNEPVFYGGRRDTEARRSETNEITKKDVYRCLQESISLAFGVSASGAVQDIQVRFYDTRSRLAMIRVPREFCNLVRSAVTLITTIQSIPVVASCISVNGCARTAKMVTMREMRKIFRGELQQKSTPEEPTSEEKRVRKQCNALEERLNQIRSIG